MTLMVGGDQTTRGKPQASTGGTCKLHTKRTRDMNPGPSCCEVTVLTTKPPRRSGHREKSRCCCWPVQPCHGACIPATEPDIWRAGRPATLRHAVCELMIVSLNRSDVLTVVHGSAISGAFCPRSLKPLAYSKIRAKIV